jgi:diphthine-ammonia ligase
MLEAGIETMIVSCNETMGDRFIGQIITPSLVDELDTMGIDVCGENGEFHTLVLDCPLFSEPINVRVTEKLWHGNYWFSKLELS